MPTLEQRKSESIDHLGTLDLSLKSTVLYIAQEISKLYDNTLDASLYHQMRRSLLNELNNMNESAHTSKRRNFIRRNLLKKTKKFFSFTSKLLHRGSFQETNQLEELFIDLIKETAFRVNQCNRSRDYKKTFLCVQCRQEFSLQSSTNNSLEDKSCNELLFCCERYLKYVQNEKSAKKRKDVTETICYLQDIQFSVVNAANLSEIVTLVLSLNKKQETRQMLTRIKANWMRISKIKANHCNCQISNSNTSTKSFYLVKDVLKNQIHVDLVAGCIERYDKCSSCESKLSHLHEWINSYYFKCFKQDQRNHKKNGSKFSLEVVKVILTIYGRLKSAINTLELVQKVHPYKDSLFEKMTSLPSFILDLQNDAKFTPYYLEANALETLYSAHNVVQHIVHEVLSLEKKESIFLKIAKYFKIVKSSRQVKPYSSAEDRKL